MGIGPSFSRDTTDLATMRQWLLALVGLAMAGSLADLLLLGHYEDGWQLPPIVLLAIGLPAVAWAGLRQSRMAIVALRATMLLVLLAGAVGVALHFDGNREFQREMDPDLTGWPLVVKVMRAKAPPALAPAAMAQIGLLGLLATYRYRPSAPRRRDDASAD